MGHDDYATDLVCCETHAAGTGCQTTQDVAQLERCDHNDNSEREIQRPHTHDRGVEWDLKIYIMCSKEVARCVCGLPSLIRHIGLGAHTK